VNLKTTTRDEKKNKDWGERVIYHPVMTGGGRVENTRVWGGQLMEEEVFWTIASGNL